MIEAVICANPLTQDSKRANLESHFQKLFGHANCRLFFHLTYAYIEDKGSLMNYLEGMAESAMPPGFTFVARYAGDLGEVKVIFLVLNLGQQRQREAAKVAGATKARKAPKSK